ncbi:MAG: hypothetical protein PVI03_04690 [Candidatus Thorarchaeota archaeon]|jgi:hypothetical protein
MRGFLTIFLALSIIFFEPKVLAQENPLDEAVSISQNQRAPFDGILIPTELAIQLGLRIESLQRRLVLEVERGQELCSARISFETRRGELEQERRDYQIRLLEDRVLEQAAELAEPTPWYRRWGFAYGMGLLTSSLLVAGGIALILGVL